MKRMSLSTLAIVAALTIGAVAPATAFAEQTAKEKEAEAAKELESTGIVEVQEGEAGGGSETIDPEDPTAVLPENPDENVNGNKGPITIEKTTNLKFGIVKTSANKVVQFASPLVYSVPVDPAAPEGAKKEIKRGHFVQWADVRAGGKYGYTVTAELAQQFTGAKGTKLESAQINFSNGIVKAQGDNENVAPSNISTGFTLDEGAGVGKNAKPVVTADKANKEGKGRFIMAFGKSDSDPEKDTTDKSVQLEIPAKTASNMAVDTYTAKIMWKIVASPE